MKLGVCLGLFDDRILGLAGVGADYAEVGLSPLQDRTPEEIDERAAQLAAAGVQCRAANLLFPGSVRLVGPQADPAAVQSYLENVLPKAARLGIRRVAFGSSGSRGVPEGGSPEAAFRQLAALCREVVAPLFAAHGMVCCLEPLRRQECNFLNTCAQGARLVEAVDHSAFRLLVDLYHLDAEGEPREDLPRYRGLLAHAHIASAKNGRNVPLPGDGEDYGAFFGALEQAGYDGGVSLEGNFGEDFAGTVRRSISYLRTWAG